LCRRWHEYNIKYFDGRLAPPLLSIESIPPPVPGLRFVGNYYRRRDDRPSRILLESAMFAGDLPFLRRGPEFAAGRERYIADVLLHEMVHQYQCEVLGIRRTRIDGRWSSPQHGRTFCARANFIGKLLQLTRVTANRRPTGTAWPHTIRPSWYYQDAYSDAYPVGVIADHWDEIAQQATEGYRRHERGLLILLVNADWQVLGMEYQTLQRTETLGERLRFTDNIRPALRESIESYDPQNEVIIMIYLQKKRLPRSYYQWFRVSSPFGCGPVGNLY